MTSSSVRQGIYSVYQLQDLLTMRVPQIYISNTNPMDHVNENPVAYIGLETRLEIVLVDPENNPDDNVDWDNFAYKYDRAMGRGLCE